MHRPQVPTPHSPARRSIHRPGRDRTRTARVDRNVSPRAARGGSTLMIVIVLLGLLSVLGTIFYLFANQERSSSEYYADAAKEVGEPGLDVDKLMDHALRQLVVGPDVQEVNSVLWGGRHSLIPNMLGVHGAGARDLTAYDGEGLSLSTDASEPPPQGLRAFVDQDQDGVPDVGEIRDENDNLVYTYDDGTGPRSNIQDLVGLNDSPAANGLVSRQTKYFPQPDVGYTYPDQNNAFLAYIGYVRDRMTGEQRRVIIPSFHRPQLYRDVAGLPIPLFDDFNYNNVPADSAGEDYDGNNLIDYGATIQNQQFRPDPRHRFVPPGDRSNPTSSRYIATATEAAGLLGDGKRVFPFLPMYDGYNPSSSGSDVTLNGRPPTWIGHQGVWSGPHPDDPTISSQDLIDTLHDDYQYDVDNDGDGVREGVWLDLDFPVQELADGTLYIPLFSMTVLDLDGLLNLNVHGNIQNLLFPIDSMSGNQLVAFNNTTNPFGYNTGTTTVEFISQSNLGLHAAEVNPAWALTGRAGIDCPPGNIGNVFLQYRYFYANDPYNAFSLAASERFRRSSFLETANMELARLKMGAPKLSSGGGTIDELLPGLYGEEHLIARFYSGSANNALVYPHPGQSQADDNGDINEGLEFQPQFRVGAVNSWLDVDQPRDTIGIGSVTAGTDPRQADRVNNGFPGSKQRWLRYTGYATNGAVQWGQGTLQAGALMRGSQAYGLFDDPSEVALYAEDDRDVDDPFPAADAAYLAMDNDDINNLALTARVADLAPFNFAKEATTNARGEEIRKKFTTYANDRKNFAIPRPHLDEDANGNGALDGGEDANGNGVLNSHRPWEFTDDNGFTRINTQDLVRFPPTFGDAGSAVPRYSGTDPLRPAVRYLLQATSQDLQAVQYQQRLAINQLLVFDWQSPNSTELVYRKPTLHPLDPGAAPIPTTAPPYQAGYPWGSAANQEFWARRDRQWLARDIYVLLYLLGGGLDEARDLDHLGSAIGGRGYLKSNSGGGSGRPLYNDQQLEQMARFAVNLVDAQDKDRVITRFEYDKDLSNGWNLDDNPYTVDTGSGVDRGEVWGVERQELVINEFIGFQTEAEANDLTETAHNDEEYRQWVCAELRNVAPYDIRFTNNQEWQLVLRQLEPNEAGYNPALERRLMFNDGAGTIYAGNFYTVYSTDRDDPASNPSAFIADPDGMSGQQWIVPRDSSLSGPPTATSSFLDIVDSQSNASPPLEIRDGSGTDLTSTAGSFLTNGSPAVGGGPGNFVIADITQPFSLILRRRAHPTRTKPAVGNAADEADNPWVEVDRFTYDPSASLDLGDSGGMYRASPLNGLQSDQRSEPLNRGKAKATAGPIGNTFSAGPAGENENAPMGQFVIHQTHFDREFTSAAELLNVPLVGPPSQVLPASVVRTDGLTSYMLSMRQPPATQYGQRADATAGVEENGNDLTAFGKTGGAMFLTPDHPTAGTLGTVDAVDNRWHRLLEFVEVPTRQQRDLGLGTEFAISRVPGKINLNMLRNPEVLAALIDDERILDIADTDSYPTRDPMAPEEHYYFMRLPGLKKLTDGNLDWFEQLQDSRDPKDPYWLTNHMRDLPLPGMPNDDDPALIDDPTVPFFEHRAHPFRPLGHALAGERSLQHTILRDLPADVEPVYQSQRRHLFEIGDQGDHAAGTTDPALRQQVLAKLWNNTTVRSHSFVVFVSAKLFRAAVDPANGAVRIGGPLKEYTAGTEERPELPEYRGVFLVDRSRLEQGAAAGGNGISDFRPFVVHRQILKQE